MDLRAVMWRRVGSAPVLVGIGLVAASLALYLATIAPSLSWGRNEVAVDGGELLAAANTFGIPHPPGYPTYTLLLKAFATVVPLGDFAFRGNLLSALLATASALTVYLVTLRLCRSLAPATPVGLAVTGAALGAATFAAAPLLWSLAIVTEVYALNALFTGALLLIASQLALGRDPGGEVDRRSDVRALAAFGLVFGIGLGNHLTLLAVGVPMVYLIGSRLGWRRLASPWLIGAFLLGLSVYLYLPLRAAQHPPINWGNADTLRGAFWMLTGRAYQEYVFGVAAGAIYDRALLWTELVFSQFNALGLSIGVMAVGPLLKLAPGFLASTLVSVALIGVYSITFNSVDFEVLMVPAFLVFSVWLGFGFFWISSTWIRGAAQGHDAASNGHPRARVSFQALALGVLAFALLPGVSLLLNFSSQNLRGDRAAADRAAAILANVPDGAVVLSSRERTVFPLLYMRYVEDPERDVAVIAVRLLQFDWYQRDIRRMFPDRVPDLDTTDVEAAIKRIVEHNAGRSRVYLTFTSPGLAGAFSLEPRGAVFEATLK